MLDSKTVATAGDRPERLLTFRSGGWIILASIVLLIVVTVVTVPPVLRNARDRPPGDLEDPATYGYALAPALIETSRLKPANMHRDIIQSLEQPEVFGLAAATTWNQDNRGKYLVPTDPVVGVVVNGEARAYPVRVLRVNEIINDVVGGTPIVVTFNPYARAIGVFGRDIDGRVREFGSSGLMYQSNHLLYERSADGSIGTESLWCQLQARAITGESAAAGLTLETIPCQLMPWSEWGKRHAETTVIAPIQEMMDRWKSASFRGFYESDSFPFPVEPVPEDPAAAKAMQLAVDINGVWHVVSFEEIAANTGGSGAWTRDLGGRQVALRVSSDYEAAWIECEAPLPPVLYSARFAWDVLR